MLLHQLCIWSNGSNNLNGSAGQNGQMHFSRQKQRTDNQTYTRLYTCTLKCTLAGKGASSTRVDKIHENIIRAKCSRLEILPRYWSFSTEKLLKPNWWRRGCVYSAAAAAACTGDSVGFCFVLCVRIDLHFVACVRMKSNEIHFMAWKHPIIVHPNKLIRQRRVDSSCLINNAQSNNNDYSLALALAVVLFVIN